MTRVGLLLPTRDRVLDGRPAVEPLIGLAEWAEEVGLDSVWVGDSPLARPRHDALTLLAAVAARTCRITVGTAVLLAPIRHPLLLLHQAATVDLVSAGRLVLGLGAGFPLAQTRQQFAALDADYHNRGRRLDDTLRLAHRLWRDVEPDAGRAIPRDQAQLVELLPGPHRSGGPPLWLAGGGPAALRRVAELADGWLPYPPTPERYAADLALVRQHAAEAGHPAPTAALYATITVGADPVRARADADRHLERYYGIPSALVRQVQATFAGTEEELLDWLVGYQQAGAEHIVVRIAGELDAAGVTRIGAIRRALNDRHAGGCVR